LDWEVSKQHNVRDKLIAYNSEDCEALHELAESCQEVCRKDMVPLTLDPQSTVQVDSLKQSGSYKWGRNTFSIPEFDFINEAAYALLDGVAQAEAIDTIARLGFAHPIGPLALADLIGLDTCVAIMEVLHRGLGDPKYAPCPLLRQYVQAGRLGRKSGRGFYEYTSSLRD